MRTLRLRPGVHYAPIEGGVYISSARATFVMGGPPVLFRVVDTCVPLLEDGSDVEELVEAMGGARARRLVCHLVETLDARGLILHLDQLAVPEPGLVVREHFPEALAYLETFRDDPYADFRWIRKARVLLAGPPEALGPAARGLVRAGVGQVLVATADPECLAGLSSRHPEVRLLLCQEGGIPMLVTRSRPNAAVVFTEDSFPTDAIQQLPATCVAIPVRLGKDLAIVGPAIGRGENPRVAERLWSRAATWSRLDGDDLLVRPSGDLLAGALAGQVVLDALIGLNPGRVHLVHGPDLCSDSISPPLTAEAECDRPVELEGRLGAASPAAAGESQAGPTAAQAGGDPGPAAGPGSSSPTGGPPGQAAGPAGDAASWWGPVSARWSGLFRVTVPGGLPQMPVALTLADGRSTCFDGRTVGFGPDQEASTGEAALEALRRHCAGRERFHRRQEQHSSVTGDHDRPTAAAAGLDQTRWLLDGALRLLAAHAGNEQAVEWLAIEDVEARRLWRALEGHELTPVRLSSRTVAGFGWTLMSVHDRRSGSLLASGWGPTPAVGAVAALSAAIATQQVRRTVDPGYEGDVTEAGYLQHLHGRSLGELNTEVMAWLGHRGSCLRGQRLRRDPITGLLAAWCGTVWLDG